MPSVSTFEMKYRLFIFMEPKLEKKEVERERKRPEVKKTLLIT